MRILAPLATLAAGLIVSSTALAQPGPGPGAGPGGSPGPGPAGRPCVAASGASGPAAADCAGPRPGMRGGMGPRARYGRDHTPGWGLMSPEEQRQHRDKMLSFTDHEQCRVYMEQHHGQMAERAKERGRTVPAQPRRDPCSPLKAAPAKK